jgi:hypothetical protein
MKSMALRLALLIMLALLFSLPHSRSLPLDGRARCLSKPSSKHSQEERKHSSMENDENSSSNDEVAFLPAKVICELNGFQIPAIIDTGAQITIMSSSCARRCRIANLIDTKYACRAIGVGSSEILGRIDNLSLRIGPMTFQSRVAILRDSPVDFLIGMDFLRRFQSDLCLSEGVLKLRVRDRPIRVPLVSMRRDIKEYLGHDVEIDDESMDSSDEDLDSYTTDEASDSSADTREDDEDAGEDEVASQDHRRKVNIYSIKQGRRYQEPSQERQSNSNRRKMSMEGV